MISWLLQHSPLLYFTQSIWRDEAFSILVAQKPILSFIGKLSFEPPVYYILLHFWMKIFGMGEIATRSLSFAGFALATVVVIFWAEKLFPKHWLSWFLPLFFFLNPMLLYYAFEIRTYGWFMFFAVLSMFAYWHKQWKLYLLASTLGFYTHTFFLLVPFATGIHYLLTNYLPLNIHKVKHSLKDPFLLASVGFLALISPWMVLVIRMASRLKDSWYYPVDVNLIRSVLGNLFIGYEGTPWFLWGFTALLSLLFLCITAFSLPHRRNKPIILYLVTMIFLPLLITIGVSFIKPMFVNRYVIPVTIAEVFLVALGISLLKKPLLQKLAGAIALIFVVSVNLWYPNKHAKFDIRKTIKEVNAISTSQDVLYVDSPLNLFEAQYYANDPTKVFLYNPSESAFPWYVGDAAFSPGMVTAVIPVYPKRAFLVHPDGTYTLMYQAPITAMRPVNPKPAPKKSP